MDRYLTTAEAAVVTGFETKTLANWRSLTRTSGKQIGPPFMKVGTRIRYEAAAVDAWMKSQPTTTAKTA